MALTRVQTTPKSTGSGARTVTFAAPPALGNAIVIPVTQWGGGFATATDNRGNTYQQATTQASGGQPIVTILYCPQIVATGDPFTITVTGGNYQVTAAIEVTGLGGGVLQVDRTAGASGTSAASATGATAALTGSEVFSVACFSTSLGQSSITVESVSPAWTEEYEELPFAIVPGEGDSRSRSSAAGTTESCSWTFSASGLWAAAVAVFKAVPVLRVNFVQAGYDGSSGATFASPAQNVTAGNTLIACFGGNAATGQSVTAVTDTAGNTYTKVTHVFQSGDKYRQEVWVAVNITAHASNVATATWSASIDYRAVCVIQYAGLELVTPLDDTEQYVAASGAEHNFTIPTLTGTTAESVHFLMSRWGFGGTVFPAGFTTFTTGGAGVPEVADKVVTGGAFSGTYAVTGNYFALAVILKAASVITDQAVTTIVIASTATLPLPTVVQPLPDPTVVLLVGAETAVVDESQYAHPLTLAGNAARSTAQFKYGAASITFDGTGDWVQADDSADWDFGSGDFTVEGWFRPLVKTTNQTFIGQYNDAGSTAASAWLLWLDGSTLKFSTTNSIGGGGMDLSASWTPTLGQWYHLAADRSGTTLRLYVDGVVRNTNASFTITINPSAAKLVIGAVGASGANGSYAFNGQADEIRITKGVARYAGAFTPPTAEFPRPAVPADQAITTATIASTATTSLPTIAQVGYRHVVSVTAGPGATGGTTGAIDTTGADLLVISLGWYPYGGRGINPPTDNKGNTWTALTSRSGTQGTAGTGQQFFYAKNAIVGTGHTFTVTTVLDSSPAIIVHAFAGSDLTAPFDVENGAHQYSFTAFSLSTGSVTPTRDGSLILSGATTGDVTLTVAGMTQTTHPYAPSMQGATGYVIQSALAAINPTWTISAAQYLTTSVAVFKAAVVVITAPTITSSATLPLPTVAHVSSADPTVVLLIGAETAILDESQYARTLTAVGNAVRTTAQFKFGAASVYLDGIADWVEAADSADFSFGTGDFTIEGFFRFATVDTNQAIMSHWDNSGVTSNNSWMFYIPSATLTFRYNRADGSGWIVIPHAGGEGAWTPTLGQWYHLAVDKNGSTVRMYVDGVVVGSNASVTMGMRDSANKLTIGTIGAGDVYPAYNLNGQFDEVRITKGLARYAGAFSPPTAPFPRPSSPDQAVTTAMITAASVLSLPVVDQGEFTILLPLLAATAVLYPPTVVLSTQLVTTGTRLMGGGLMPPTVIGPAGAITAGTIAEGSMVFAPVNVFAPGPDQDITAGTIGTATLYPPYVAFPETRIADQPTLLLTWMEMTDKTGMVHVWSSRPLPDPAEYYHGWKEARVLSWGTLRRALSDEFGQYEGITMSVVLSDADRILRELLNNPATRYLMGRPVEIRVIEDAARRRQEVPRTLVKGVIDAYRPSQELQFEMTMSDTLAQQFSMQSETAQIPKRRITLVDFPGAAGIWSVVIGEGEGDDAPEAETGEVSAVGLPVPIIYGEITDTQIIGGIDHGDGQCPFIYVGDENIGGSVYHAFLVAGHACKSVYEIYTSNNPIGLQSGGGGGNWLVPGHPGWPFGPPYRDINGNRYCIVYGRGPEADYAVAKKVEPGVLSFAVQGIETKGDGSGELITDLLLQYRHCLQNWVFGDYRSGNWLASPPFPGAPPPASQIDDASFDQCSEIAKARQPGGPVTVTMAGGVTQIVNVPAGYRGDFILGWSSYDAYGGSPIGGTENLISVRDLVARFNMCCDTRSGFNRKCLFFVRMIDDSEAAVVAQITDAFDIIKGSFDIVDDLEHLYNVVPYQHTQDYFQRDTRAWRFVTEVSDAASMTNYSPSGNPQRIVAPSLDLYMLRGWNRNSDSVQYIQGSYTIADVVARFLSNHKDPPRLVNWTMGANGQNIDLGDVVELTHFAGMSATGWVKRPLFVLRHETDLDNQTVTFQGFDLRPLRPLMAAPPIEPPEEVIIPAGTIMVGGDGYKGRYAFLSPDGTTMYPPPPSEPIPGDGITALCRTENGHIARIGDPTPSFPTTGVGLLQDFNLTVLSEYTGTRPLSSDGICPDSDDWYFYTGGFNSTTNVMSIQQHQGALSYQARIWDVAVPAGFFRMRALAQHKRIIASTAQFEVYCWMDTLADVGKWRIHKVHLPYSDAGGVLTGTWVGQVSTDVNEAPGYGSLMHVPGSDDVIAAFHTIGNAFPGAIKRYTPDGTVVWTAGTPAGAGTGNRGWSGVAHGVTGDTHFLAWGFDAALATYSECRFCWFSYATGAPDNTRNFAPEDGDFLFDSQAVVLQDPVE